MDAREFLYRLYTCTCQHLKYRSKAIIIELLTRPASSCLLGDLKFQALQGYDPDLLPFLYALFAPRIPVFPSHKYLSCWGYPASGLANLIYHSLCPGFRLPELGPYGISYCQYEEPGSSKDGRDYYQKRCSKVWERGIKQHDGTKEHGNYPSYGKDPITRDHCLSYE